MADDFYYARPGRITPVALVGHNIAIWVSPTWVAYRVAYFEPLPRSAGLVFDLGAVVAGADTAVTSLANLELRGDPPEMAQLRFYPLDDIQVNMRRGQSDQRFTTKNIVARADLFSIQVDPCLHQTEIIVLKDDEPLVQATNPTGYNLAQSRVAFFGFKFILTDLKKTFKTYEEAVAALRQVTFIAAGGL